MQCAPLTPKAGTAKPPPTIRPDGGIGRRAGFRYQCCKTWRFESSSGHQYRKESRAILIGCAAFVFGNPPYYPSLCRRLFGHNPTILVSVQASPPTSRRAIYKRILGLDVRLSRRGRRWTVSQPQHKTSEDQHIRINQRRVTIQHPDLNCYPVDFQPEVSRLDA